jgi:hypothetical protein
VADPMRTVGVTAIDHTGEDATSVASKTIDGAT